MQIELGDQLTLSQTRATVGAQELPYSVSGYDKQQNSGVWFGSELDSGSGIVRA